MIELSVNPANVEAPRSAFMSRITPIPSFFIRDHGARPAHAVTAIDIANLPFPVAALAAMPQHTVEAVLQCAGNGRALFAPPIDGVPWRFGAMGNALWTGARLADVLRRANAALHAARYVVARGADFAAAIPLAKALHPDTLVALQMNGEPLSPTHGAPARLVVPGWAGNAWIKWLTSIELVADEPALDGYRIGGQLLGKLVVKSQLASIAPGDVIAAGEHELVGVAFSGEARIARVDVSIDGAWHAAELDAHDSDYGFRVFRHAWHARPGRTRIAARATDTTGATQPLEAAWNPGGYLYNAIEFVDVVVQA